MAPNSKVAKAFKAMKDIGIPEETVKPVLKNLLDLYDKSWILIEDENYRVLVDAIFDHEFPKREEYRKQESQPEYEPEECEPPLKKYCLRSQTEDSSAYPGDCSPGFNITSSRTQGEAHVSQSCCKLKVDLFPYLCLGEKNSETETISSPQHCRSKEKRTSSSQCLKEETRPSYHLSDNIRAESDGLSPPTHVIDNREVPVPLQLVQRAKRLNYKRGTPGGDLSLEENVLDKYHNNALILMSERDDEDQPQFEVPLAIIPPGPPTLLYEDGSSDRNCSDFEGNGLELQESEHLDAEDNGDDASDLSQFDLASSPKGDVKISLICNSSQRSCLPSLDAVLELVEEKYRKTYRITEPDFSPMKLMKDICECFLAEGTNCSDDGQVRSINISWSLAVSQKFNAQDVLHARGNHQGDFCIPPSFPNVPFRFQNLIEVLPQIPRVLALDILHCIRGFNLSGNSHGGSDKKIKALGGLGYLNLSSLVVVQKQSSHPGILKAPLYVDDITRGGENVKISLVNETSDVSLPAFYYIPRNIVYQNAYVKFLLARISDENCCSNCFGDCTSLAMPCACAGETGGEFAYTPGGLVEDKFLEKCISMSRDPQDHHFFYCNDCPLERSSKDKRLSGQCKGHLVRQFIKECWHKCGCSNKCGNRLVQRGITVSLQVFMTSEGKGWGLRTLEDLPKGAFACEYVGEIVTNMELFRRNTCMSDSEKHTYPVLLDADWGSEGVLRDEEALCLDATTYGNVARFINHRCFDANLVEIPIEVETPDHHYYHLAFFTTRKVNALEELTWDYGIDFKDHSHPVKAFHCCCGSKFCRDVTRPKRARSSS